MSPRDDLRGPDVLLRRGIPSDAPRLARVAAALFTETSGAANRPEDMTDYLASAFSEEQQRRELSEPSTRVWLAMEATGEIAGLAYVRLNVSPPTSCAVSAQRPAELARLYTEQRWHGKGLGQQLMEAVLRTAREHESDIVWLGVWERNARAIAFYRKEGFETVGEQDFILGSSRQRDFVMVRRLAATR